MTMLTDVLRRTFGKGAFVPSIHCEPIATKSNATADGPAVYCRDDPEAKTVQTCCGAYRDLPIATSNLGGSVVGLVSTIASAGRNSSSPLKLIHQLADRLAGMADGRLLVVDVQQETSTGSSSLQLSVGELRRALQQKIHRPVSLADHVRPTSNPTVFLAPKLVGLCGGSSKLPQLIRFMGDCRQDFDVSLISVNVSDLTKSRELLQRCDDVYILFETGQTGASSMRQCLHELSRIGAAVRGALFVQRHQVDVPNAA